MKDLDAFIEDVKRVKVVIDKIVSVDCRLVELPSLTEYLPLFYYPNKENYYTFRNPVYLTTLSSTSIRKVLEDERRDLMNQLEIMKEYNFS